MPAPSADSINTFLTEAALGAGFVKQTYVDGVLTPSTPPALPDDMALLVKALATGLSAQWVLWQAEQVVTIPSTSPVGAPSAGILP